MINISSKPKLHVESIPVHHLGSMCLGACTTRARPSRHFSLHQMPAIFADSLRQTVKPTQAQETIHLCKVAVSLQLQCKTIVETNTIYIRHSCKCKDCLVSIARKLGCNARQLLTPTQLWALLLLQMQGLFGHNFEKAGLECETIAETKTQPWALLQELFGHNCEKAGRMLELWKLNSW